MQQSVMKKGPVITIAIITAVSIMGNEMLFIVMPIYWKFFGLTSLWQVGVILSINRFIRIPINTIVGWCYQKISKRTGILIAVVLASISTYSYGILKGFALLILARILWGIAWSFLRLGGYLTVISCSDSRSRGHLIGLYNGLWGLGSLLGILIGGLFAGIVGIQTIAATFAVLAFLSIPFAYKFIPNTLEVVQTTEGNKSILTSKRHIKIMANGLIIALIVYGIFFSTISKIVEYHLDHPLELLGYALGATAVAGVIQSIKLGIDPFIAPLIGRWSDIKYGRVPILIFSLLVGMTCMLIIPFNIPFIWFLVMIFIFQICSTIMITSSDSMAVDLANGPTSVKTMTYYTLFSDLGAALGPLISFMVLDFIGIPWLYWFTSFLLFCMFLFWLKENQKEMKKAV